MCKAIHLIHVNDFYLAKQTIYIYTIASKGQVYSHLGKCKQMNLI